MPDQIMYPDASMGTDVQLTMTPAQERIAEMWRERLYAVMAEDGGHIRDRLMDAGLVSRAADMVVYSIIDEVIEQVRPSVIADAIHRRRS